MSRYNRAKRTLNLQHGQSDCGIACLASIIEYHGGTQTYEKLKELSGAGIQGVSLLGLFQAAEQVGFKVEGFMAETVENLRELSNPAILHVTIENSLPHFIVFYGFDAGHVIIGDPAKGVISYSKEQLAEVWKSKSLLVLEPADNFLKTEKINADKKQWVMQLIKEDLHLLLIALFLGILISFLNLSSAFFSQTLIDDILPGHNKEKLIVSLSLFTIILVFRCSIGYLRGLFVVRQSKNFNGRIIEQFYQRLLRLPKYFFDTRKVGELIARMNDTRRIQSVIGFVAGAVVIDLLVVIISIAFLFAYSSVIGSILIFSLPLFGLLIKIFNKRIIDAQHDVMHSYALSESHYVDAMQGISTIKVNNRETFFDNLNKRFYTSFQERIFGLGLLNNRFNFFSELIGMGSIITVFAIASFMVLDQSMRLGEVIAILSIVSGVIPSINRLTITNIQVQEARIAFERMYEFASVAPENNGKCESDVPDANAFTLDIKNLSFRFPGHKLLLTDVTFSIPDRGMIALLGESGSGKSTLIQILQKFYEHESGSIKFNERSLTDISTTWWRSILGVVPQDIKIFNGGLLYNIALSDNEYELEKAIKFCKEFGFDFYFDKFPQGYLSILGEEGINISGGQKQLVALARALYKKPKLLILDEATAAMDKLTERFILDLLQKLRLDISIILVTHKMDSARLADKVYFLDNNGVLREAQPATLEGFQVRNYTAFLKGLKERLDPN